MCLLLSFFFFMFHIILCKDAFAVKIKFFIVHDKIIHGNLSLVCTLCNIKL